MKIAVLLLSTMFIAAQSARAQDRAPIVEIAPSPIICAPEVWLRAVTVATGHGANFEIEARQIGRDRCDCKFEFGKPKVCEATRVSEAEAVPPELNR
jgi:hypothetical protein